VLIVVVRQRACGPAPGKPREARLDKEAQMAKGQLRSNKEAKKPKKSAAEKGKASGSSLAQQSAARPAAGGKKK
jgi:hypothetical protein